MTDDSKLAQKAFRATLAHEISHLTEELSPKDFSGADQKFLCRINEVRADYCGTYYGLHGNYKEGIQCMEIKKHRCLIDIPDREHPSWKQRILFLSRMNFDEKLVREIAQTLHYKNENLIKTVIDYYCKTELKLK